METRKGGKAGKPTLLGKLLAMLPVSCALLYPLYLAAQLDTVEAHYRNGALPRAFDGLRVAYVSDIHYGAFLKEDRVRALVRRVNALQPDLILLGGDYGDDSETAIPGQRRMDAGERRKTPGGGRRGRLFQRASRYR